MQNDNMDNSCPTKDCNIDLLTAHLDIPQDSAHPQDVSLAILETPGINRESSISASYLALIESSPQENTAVEDSHRFETNGNDILKHCDSEPTKISQTSSYLTPTELNSQKESKRGNSTLSYLTPSEVTQIKETTIQQSEFSRDQLSVVQHGNAKNRNYENGGTTRVAPRQGSSDSYDYHVNHNLAIPGVPPVPQTDRDDHHLYQTPENTDIEPQYDYIDHGDGVTTMKIRQPLPPTPTKPDKSGEGTPKNTSYRKSLCYICIGVSIVLILVVVAVLAYYVMADKFLGVKNMSVTSTSSAPLPGPNTGQNQTFTTSSQIQSVVNTEMMARDYAVIENETRLPDSQSDLQQETTEVKTTVRSTTTSVLPLSSTTSTTIFTSSTITPQTDQPGENTCGTNTTLSTECQEVICDAHTSHYRPYPDPRNIVLWYHDVVLKHAFIDKYEAYFIKVLVIPPVSNKLVPVKTVNKVGTMTESRPQFDFSVKPGDLYGTRVTCRQTQVVCMEFKKGGEFSDGINPDYEDYPVIELSVEDPGITYTVEPNADILRDWKRDGLNTYSISHNKFTFSMPFHETIFQSWPYGVYRSILQFNATEARRIGRENCEKGASWAVMFTAT